MAQFNKFDAFVSDLANGVHNLGSNQLEIALSNTIPVHSNSVLANIVEIDYSNLSSRLITEVSSSQTLGLYKLFCSNLTLTAHNIVPTFQYIVLYNAATTNKNLIGWYDNGSSVSMTGSQTFTINFDQVNGVIQIQ